MKTMRSDSLAIMIVLIALVNVVWTGTAQASAEEDMFTATTQPDALIILDLSGSMAQKPSGDTYIYGSSSSCTADTTKCVGPSHNYPYAHDASGVANTDFCMSAPAAYPYAADSTCAANTSACVAPVLSPYPDYHYASNAAGTPDTTNCSSSLWPADCANGYCKTSKSSGTGRTAKKCQTLRDTVCSGGYCQTSTTNCAVNCNYNCVGGFCAQPKTPGCDVDFSTLSCASGFCRDDLLSNCNVDCSKLAIAKRSIFSFLDDNNDGQITAADKTSLGVRMGYMRFFNCSGSSQEGGSAPTYNYSTGCNTLIRALDSPYSAIYCGDNTSCASSTAGSGTANTVSGETSSGYTPLAAAQEEAKLYLDWHKSADAAAACRGKFVIFITDGADTMACNAGGSTKAPQRRESVRRAKALADQGYKVFVIGFGAAMPEDEKNTLNWMAYYGRTDDPNTANTGSTTSYSLTGGCDPITNPTACCTNANPTACYPSGVASCSTSTSNDPGLSTLGGYAYIAADADALAAALRSTINIIRQANYSFSQASIQASRTQDENFLYEGSFEPADSSEPFWKGHLKKYQIGSDGTVGAVSWDAGALLQSRTDTSRNILTYTGALADFNTTNAAITTAMLGVTTADERAAIIGYIRGDAVDNPEFTLDPLTLPWKLGDVFRSMPITVGTPAVSFNDVRDCGNQFADHRTAHPRTSANGRRLIVVGANDGQAHGFKTSDGAEAWSFIPPNLLPKLKNLTHFQHPANQSHQYFNDGPITVADIWDGTTATGCSSSYASCSGNGECKAANSWKTIMVFSEGRGASDYAWSTSSSCSTGLGANYSVTAGTPAVTTTYPYYCGYHALNLNDSLNPTYMWHLNFADATATASQAPYIGDPWSKMMIGRVRVKESGEQKEKWVGFIGAGYNGSDCTGSGACDTRGKGFFVVDLTNGNILWSFTKGSSNTSTTSTTMIYSIPAAPAIADTDGDGFIDTAYIGDLGGNMWRFAFCRDQDMLSPSTCGISGQTVNWSGGKFFDATAGTGNTKPIYTSASVAKDTSSNIWVYWATGNKIAPTAKTGVQEYMYGVKDGRTATPYNADANLTTFEANSTTTFDPTSSKAGFRIKLANPNLGEKVLSDSTVFGGNVYFTSYTPSEGTDACNQSGTARLYGINFTTAAGVIPESDTSTTLTRSKVIGSGIPSAPVISMKPGTADSATVYAAAYATAYAAAYAAAIAAGATAADAEAAAIVAGRAAGAAAVAQSGGNTPDLYVTTSGTGGGVTGTTVTSASTNRVNFDPPGSASRTNILYWRDRRIQ